MKCLTTDVGIIGGGLAGATAAAMLGRAGHHAMLIDPHMEQRPEFRCEKLDDSQLALLRLAGLADDVLPQACVDGQVWVARYGRLIDHRHPRTLAPIKPTQLALSSFLVTIAHGAGFLLVPIYLGLGTAAGHAVQGGMHQMAENSFLSALIVSIVHTLAMIVAGDGIAWLVYKYLGLHDANRSWRPMRRCNSGNCGGRRSLSTP